MTTEHVWDTYADQLRRYIQARVQWPAVDDILQQVFLIVHEKLETLQNKEALKSRLYRVTQNTIVDWYRKVYWDKDGQFDEWFWDTLEDPIENDQDAVLVRKVSSCLLPMIEDMDEQTRDVLQRYLDRDMTHQMIADELWLSESNVKVIIHRAKKKLKTMYNTCCNQYRDDKGRLIDAWCRSECWCDNTVLK